MARERGAMGGKKPRVVDQRRCVARCAAIDGRAGRRGNSRAASGTGIWGDRMRFGGFARDGARADAQHAGVY